jgi:hypothetical protein
VSELTATLDEEDLKPIAANYAYYIRLGRAGSEDVLARALNKYGDKEMAVDYLTAATGHSNRPLTPGPTNMVTRSTPLRRRHGPPMGRRRVGHAGRLTHDDPSMTSPQERTAAKGAPRLQCDIAAVISLHSRRDQ